MKPTTQRRPRAAAVAGLALWALAGTALAQGTPAAAPAPTASLPASAAAPAASAAVSLTAADVAAIAGTCVNCHGAQGHPVGGLAPLYGLPAPYLRERMLAFKADAVPGATLMPRLMRGYSPAQIEALAHWLSTPETQGARP